MIWKQFKTVVPGQAASISILLLNVLTTPSRAKIVSWTKRMLKDGARI